MRAAVAGVLALVAALPSALAGGCVAAPGGYGTTGPTAPAGALAPPGPSAPRGAEPMQVPSDPAQLAGELNQAQTVIDDPASSPLDLQSAGRLEQLAAVALGRDHVRLRRVLLSRLTGPAARSLRADLAAAAALSRLSTPRKSLPPWKIVAPPAPQTQLGYFRAAQARFGVPWQYLAAIELIETDFGRVVGLSTAGAEGPMQFMPATWAQYGSGNVHNPRDAVLGAARYLVANGAPGDMATAIYHYNQSDDYVTAVRDYATRMAEDWRAFYGYYNWQVILALRRELVILPVGFPRARPVPVSRVTALR